MRLNAPTGNLPSARIDVTTWTYHAAPPAHADAALDRAADRLFTVARAIHWTTAVFLVVAVLPAVLDLAILLPPAVLAVGAVLTVTASVVTGFWHQHLRTRTGIPVIPVLENMLQPTASMLHNYRQAFDITLQQPTHEELAHFDASALRGLRRAARGALRQQRKLARQFIIYSELAAQADRRGWEGLRDRHVRTIASMVDRITSNPDNDTEHDTDAAATTEPRTDS